MITCIKITGHGQQCTIMYEVYGHFSWHTISVLIGDNSFIWGNGQSKMFARVLAMGHHW